jgi:FkbM family methyltransferase
MTKPGSVFMEVGAGVGAHALHLARLVGSSGHLLLYEPRPIVQRVLRQNLGSNQIGNVTVLRHSIGRLLQFDLTGNNTSREPGELRSRLASSTKTETLDELQLEQLHLLKVNNNTSASDVLDGASEKIWRLRPKLFVSVQNPQSLKIAQARAEQFSYHCWRVDTPLFNPGNFNSRDTDIFDGRSVSALLAIPEEIEVGMALDGCVEL